MAGYKDVDLEKITQTREIADAIRRISDGVAKLHESGLTEDALLLLIKDASGVPKYHVKKILDILPRLKDIYCK